MSIARVLLLMSEITATRLLFNQLEQRQSASRLQINHTGLCFVAFLTF